MGRRRKAWLWAKTGKRPNRTGYWVRWYEYTADRRIAKCLRFETLQNARRWVRERNARVDLQQLGDAAPVTVREAMEGFIRGCSQLAEYTIVAYSIALRGFHEHVGLDTIVTSINSTHVDHYITKISSSRRPATVQKHLSAISRFFNWCMKNGYASSNPVRHATSRPKGSYVKKKYIPTDEQIAKFIEAIDTPDRKLAIAIAVTTGLDRNVIANLRASNIDIRDQVIRVTRVKTGKQVIVPIHPSILHSLKDRLRTSSEGHALLSGLHRWGKEYNWFRKAAKAAGLPDYFVFQTLRAVATTRMIRSGIPAAEVQKLLSHSSIQTTLGHYHTLDPNVLDKCQQLPLPGFQGSPKSTEQE